MSLCLMASLGLAPSTLPVQRRLFDLFLPNSVGFEGRVRKSFSKQELVEKMREAGIVSRAFHGRIKAELLLGLIHEHPGRNLWIYFEKHKDGRYTVEAAYDIF